ncbi:TonB-dependent receptor [Novosphingobium sp. FSY-8]|uniref:TonB-dependent receptor n=1 Tax=Novosphingobium ovatum TaxID=1908523 RepID=A0ABW9XC27_9SPHN|nr:TonB-dependent receptor [Novosphingobium ovatum]NBC36047.1 TonB-dependent receptor [Novosphingobium ovatum]
MTRISRATARRSLSAAAVLLATVSTPALAQTEAPAPAPAAGALGEIVVTAERRAQNLQQVPISATVLTGADLQKKGVSNLSDIQQVAPSIAINTVNRSTFVNIRGIGIAQSAPTSNPGVAYYIDGVLIPHEQFIGMSFYDIGSIEVLRGPQGTLTGQNSTGGAIYVRTPKPEYNAVNGSLDTTGGNYNRFRTVLTANYGGDSVAVRLAYVHDERDSYTRNISSKAVVQPGNMLMDSVRLTMAMRSSDSRLNVQVNAEYFNSRSDGIAIKRRNDTVSTNPFEIEEDARSYMNQYGYRLGLDARYDLSEAVQARYLVSWQDGFTVDQVDGDRSDTALPRPVTANTGRVSTSSTEFRTLINEFNILSTKKGPLQWVFGGFMMNETIPVELLRDNFHVVDYVSATSNITTTAKNTTYSLFGQVNYYLTPALEVIVGGRYSWDKQEYTRYAVTTVLATPYVSDIQTNQLTGKLGLNYHLGRSLIYATASKGYKAGGVNLTPGTPNFTPERNFVYEVGFKTELLDRHLRVNGDLFYSVYKDMQLSSQVGGLPTTQNALGGHSKGGELEVTGQFGALGFNIGVGYLDAKFSNSACISDTNAPGTDVGCATNLRFVPQGRALPFSPELTLNAGLQYTFTAGSLDITPRVQWSHTSSQWSTPFPYTNTFVPGRDLIDARVTFDLGKRIQLEAFVQNLTNKVYIASQLQGSSTADGGIIYGAPRTYGARVKFTFGK